MKSVRRFASLSVSASIAASGCSGSAPSAAFPESGSAAPAARAESTLLAPAREGAASTGRYRNLFAELGKPGAEIDAKVTRAYQHLFHGADDARVVFAAGQNERGPLAYVYDVGNDDVRSEGMSYGMMIAVECDKKADFDAIWNWAKTHMQVLEEGHPAHGYFSWKLSREGVRLDDMPAPDGEEYFATALLFASQRWGSGAGIYDYGREALALLDAMKNRKALSGAIGGGRVTTVVPLFNTEHQMVRFTPDANNFPTNGDHTDPSYHLPAFYEVWARVGPRADRSFWAGAARASRDHFARVAHPTTGLSPDYSNFDGTPKAASWDAHTVDFRHDAWRTAMNWSVDAAWWAQDPREMELSDRLLGFFSAQGEGYPSTYALDGTPTDHDHSLGLVATNAVAALAARDPKAARFVEELYGAEPPTGKWRYYNGLLYMMALLHVSGQFRVYAPASG